MFPPKHLSGFLQRRLDYFFVSNSLQESIKDTEILAALSCDHSPVSFSLVSTKPSWKGKRLWKFNNSLLLKKLMKWNIKILMTIKFDGNLLNTE